MWRSGSIAVVILNLCSIWGEWSVLRYGSFNIGKSPRCPTNRILRETLSRSGGWGRRRIWCPCRKLKQVSSVAWSVT